MHLSKIQWKHFLNAQTIQNTDLYTIRWQTTKACYSDRPSEQNLLFRFKESSYPTVSSYWPSEFTSASSQGHVLNRQPYLMTSLGQFCPMLYSINGQSLSWDSPSSWLRRYQLNIRFQGSVFLVPCPRHLSFTRSESWLNLSQPFLP